MNGEPELARRITPEEDGRRVREVLRRTLNLSYTALKRAKWNGEICLNGERVHTDALVRTGDLLTVNFPEISPVYALKPFSLPLTIPYEDEYFLIVDKPAPLASQSSRNQPDDSLENALFAYFGCPRDYVFRPVNRLDKGTSGLMTVAKTAHAQHLLQRMLHGPDFVRRYLALTEGVPDPPEGVLDFPIAKVPGATLKRTVSPDGQPARTWYRVLETNADSSRALVSLQLETGRTHQIRVHLSHIGCPVAGDFLYGTELPDEFPGRFALHSAELILRHPFTGERLELHSDPPWGKG